MRACGAHERSQTHTHGGGGGVAESSPPLGVGLWSGRRREGTAHRPSDAWIQNRWPGTQPRTKAPEPTIRQWSRHQHEGPPDGIRVVPASACRGGAGDGSRWRTAHSRGSRLRGHLLPRQSQPGCLTASAHLLDPTQLGVLWYTSSASRSVPDGYVWLPGAVWQGGVCWALG